MPELSYTDLQHTFKINFTASDPPLLITDPDVTELIFGIENLNAVAPLSLVDFRELSNGPGSPKFQLTIVLADNRFVVYQWLSIVPPQYVFVYAGGYWEVGTSVNVIPVRRALELIYARNSFTDFQWQDLATVSSPNRRPKIPNINLPT